jgi:predicted ABC-type ATPase
VKDLELSLNIDDWPIDFSNEEFFHFLGNSPLQTYASVNFSELIIYQNHRISLKYFSNDNNTYLAAAISDFLRFKLIQTNSSFSFESVFSHASKLLELEKAKKAGFKIYFYYITTSNPIINLERIKNRVKSGGHDVPEEKVQKRYVSTMNILFDAVRLVDRAYFFDNSKEEISGAFDFFAEKKGNHLYIADSVDSVPHWFNENILKHLK